MNGTIPLERQLDQEATANAITEIENARVHLIDALKHLDASRSRMLHVQLGELIADVDVFKADLVEQS